MSAPVQINNYTTTKEIASSWWKALPNEDVFVCCQDHEGQEHSVNEYIYTRKDGGSFLEVWQRCDPHNRVAVNTRPAKKDSQEWEINVIGDFDRKSRRNATLEIVVETLIKLGAKRVIDPIRHKRTSS
jgi:hypothetical protein